MACRFQSASQRHAYPAFAMNPAPGRAPSKNLTDPTDALANTPDPGYQLVRLRNFRHDSKFMPRRILVASSLVMAALPNPAERGAGNEAHA